MAKRYISRGTFKPFKKLIREGYIYVDKTSFLCELAQSEESYLLTRPRRMGKSTLISTLEYLFSKGTVGTENLACHTQWSEPYCYFVFRFSWAKAGSSSVDRFKASIVSSLKVYAKYFGIDLPLDIELPEQFEYLINQSKLKLADDNFLKQHPEITDGNRPFCRDDVVLLIDEYDAPLTKNLDNEIVFEEIRSAYQQLFSTIKDLDFRFVMITGVSSYAQTSIFSGANQFINLSLEDEYSTCCGYTQEELQTYFSPELKRAQESLGIASYDEFIRKLSYYYDGYNFSRQCSKKSNVFNPVCVSRFLEHPTAGFREYWFETGEQQTFLPKLLEICNQSVATELFTTLYSGAVNHNTRLNSKIVDYFTSVLPIISLPINQNDLDKKPPKLLSVDIQNLIVKIKDVKNITSQNAITILYQAGYLSIKSVSGTTAFLGIANYEVAYSLFNILKDSILNKKLRVIVDDYQTVFESLHKGGKKLANLIDCILRTAPKELFAKHSYENIISAFIHQTFLLAHIVSLREVTYGNSRADLVIYQKNADYLIEDVVIEFMLARKTDNILIKLDHGCKQVIKRGYGISVFNPTPKRYCIVISTDLKKVGAIATIDANNTIKKVYQSPNVGSNGKAITASCQTMATNAKSKNSITKTAAQLKKTSSQDKL